MRFDSIKYNDETAEKNIALKSAFELCETMVERLDASRAKAIAMTKLEESFMWVGKALRDEQLKSAAGQK